MQKISCLQISNEHMGTVCQNRHPYHNAPSTVYADIYLCHCDPSSSTQ
jgi:hypothetical protein